MSSRDLPAVELAEQAAAQWRTRYGIEAIYLNDIAAAALIKVTDDITADHVAAGLRHLFQDLWALELARPVLGIYWPAPDAQLGTAEKLRALTWDDERHRGDFVLREVEDEAEARSLLQAMIGDTMGALDNSAMAAKVGLPEVVAIFADAAAKYSGVDGAQARLFRALLHELESKNGDRAHEQGLQPDLVAVLDNWAGAEAGTR